MESPGVVAARQESLPALVRRAQGGDHAAFASLVERCHARIHRWALLCTGDPDDADDVVQEVAVQLQRRLKTYRGEAAFTTWLYRVTQNTAVQFGRWRWRRRPRTVPLSEGHAVENPDRLEQLFHGQVGGLIRVLFRDLPPRQRAVFDLADLQGMGQAEIAEMLDMKPVTVRANLFKARRAIRQRILDEHPEVVEDV